MPLSLEFRQQIEAVYQSALRVDPMKRPSYLDQACGGNLSLRQEVESLLSASDFATTRSQSTPSEVATELIDQRSGTLIGQSIAHYKIMSLLGRGGMGEVYLAHDSRLGRNVALKLLPKSLNDDEDRLRRFAREARSASALNHPNVSVIHEIGETENGRRFIAMEHIEGITLRQRLKQGPIELRDAVSIAQQVAAALMAAHRAGVVHRDIKPENIMLRPDGYVKVLDFGLAKLTEKYSLPSDSEAATFPGFDTHSEHLIGTIYYLSPEQAKRQPIDERTDIWSLGVVLYEMLVGRMPFSGATPSHAIVAILESEPEELARTLDGVPVTLERIVRKALQKNRTERYGTVNELASDLETVKQELATGSFAAAKPAQKKTDSRFALTAIGVLLVLVAGGVIFSLLRHRAPEPVPTSINSVAVLPFVNTSNDPRVDYLSDGMTDSLINKLSQLPNLTVIGRNSAFRYRGVQTDTQTVGKELGVQAILTGRIVEQDGNLSIYLDLEDVRDKHHIWGAQYNRKVADLLVIQDEISQIVTEKLRVRISGEDEKRVTKRYTDNVDAYQAYLKGRWYWSKRTVEGQKQATLYFKQAIDIDPSYALAYAGLADVAVIDGSTPLRESYLRAKAATAKALSLDDNLGEAHATLGFIYTHYEKDWARGEAEFKRAIELNPSYATAHHWYGDHLLIRGRMDEAQREFQRAAELDPLDLQTNIALGLVDFYRRNYDAAAQHLKATTKIFPESFLGHLYLGWAYTQKKMYTDAAAEYKLATEMSKGYSLAVAMTGYNSALLGNRKNALQTIKELEALRSRGGNVPALRFALIYTALGDKDKAFEWLNRAYEEFDLLIVYVQVSPFFDPLRSDRRFDDLVRRLNLA